MISREDIKAYRGMFFMRGGDHLYVPPHVLLRPYISNYTFSFPTPQVMPDEYTILPSASSTLVVSVDDNSIASGLRGVNTKACHVGAHANKMKMLLLIEFRPGGLVPFLQFDQRELLDSSIELAVLDKTLTHAVENALMNAESIQMLKEALDRIFLAILSNQERDSLIAAIMHSIFVRHGEVSMRELSKEIHYSEKHMRRLFLHHVGTSPKLFSRVVRVNYALRLLQDRPSSFTEVAAHAGYFDQPHFIHEFQTICGLSPQEYKRNMSVFYNDQFKMQVIIRDTI